MPKQTALDTINRLIAEENSSGATRQRTGDAVRTIDRLIADEEENDRRREEEERRRAQEQQQTLRNAASAGEAMDMVRSYGDYALERRAAETPATRPGTTGGGLTPAIEAEYQRRNGVNRAPTAYQTYMMQVANSQPAQEETRSTDELRRDMNRQNRIARGTERMAADMGNQMLRDQSLIYNPTYTSELRTMGQTREAQQAKADRATELYQTLSVQRREQEEQEKYAALMSNPDFVAKSQGDPTIGNKTSSTSLAPAERLYQKIFHRNDTKDANGNNKDAAGSDAARFVNDEEAAIFYYLWNTQGAKAAQSYYYGYVENRAGERRAQLAQQQAQAYGEYDPVGASIARVGYNAMSGIGLVDMALQNLTRALGITDRNKPLNYNSDAQLPGQVADALQSGASNFVEQFAADEIKRIKPNVKHPENYAKVASFLYQTGMSMADSSVAIALNLMGIPEPLTLANMGASAGTRAIREARERGATDGQALAFGFSSAIMEALFEKISLDRILEPSYAQTAKAHFLNALKQSVTEGSEEVMTTLANTAMDQLIMGDKSELFDRQRQLMEMGVSEKEALGAAFKQWGTEVLGDALGGLISGAGMGGIKEFGAGLRTVGQNYRAGLVQEDLNNFVRAQRAERAQRDAYERNLQLQASNQQAIADQNAREIAEAQNRREQERLTLSQQRQAAHEQQERVTTPPLPQSTQRATETQQNNGLRILKEDTARTGDVTAALRDVNPGIVEAMSEDTTIRDAVNAVNAEVQKGTISADAGAEFLDMMWQAGSDNESRQGFLRSIYDTGTGELRPQALNAARRIDTRSGGQTLRLSNNAPAARQAPLTVGPTNDYVNANRQEVNNGQKQAEASAASEFRLRARENAAGREALGGSEWTTGVARLLEAARNTRTNRNLQQRADAAARLQDQAEARRLVKQSGQDLGIEDASDAKTVTVLDNDMLGREWEQMVSYYASKGVKLQAMIGQIETKDLRANGKPVTVRAWVSGDGKNIIVQADHPTLSWQQLLAHEELHRRIKENSAFKKAAQDALLADKSLKPYLSQIIDRYTEAYRAVKPGITDDEIIEELLADYRAGFDMLDPLGTLAGVRKATKAAARDIRALERKGVPQAESNAEEQPRGSASTEIESPYNRTALLTEDTVDRWLKDYAAKSSPKYAQAYVTRMSPEQFLKLTTSRTGRLTISSQTGPMDAEQLIKSTQEQPLQLIIRDGEVVGHEGRHRVTALDRANVQSIPVLVFDSSNKNSKTDVPEMVLQGQDFGSSRSYDRVTLENMIPLSYENRDRIVQEYGKQDAFERSAEKIGLRQTMKFSLNMPVEETADLIAVHNLTERNLIDMGALGGAPAPSIAIVKAKAGHSKYGPISLVYGKDTIDPRKNSKNKVYGSDAWTPTAPKMGYQLDEKTAKAIRSRVENILGDEAGVIRLHLDDDNLSDQLNRNYGSFADAYKNDTEMRYVFLKDTGRIKTAPTKEKTYSDLVSNKALRDLASRYDVRDLFSKSVDELMEYEPELREWAKGAYIENQTAKGKDPETVQKIANVLYAKPLTFAKMNDLLYAAVKMQYEGNVNTVDSSVLYDMTKEAFKDKGIEAAYERWLDELSNGIIAKKGIRNQKDFYTPSGNRRSFDALYDPYTLENIVKAMSKEQQRGAETFGITAGSLQSVTTPAYRNIAEIKADSGRLGAMDEEEYRKLKEDLDNRISDAVETVYKNTKHFNDNRFMEYDSIAEALINAARGDRSKDSIMRSMRRDGYTINDSVAEELESLYAEAALLPTEYFEAKPMRAVGFDEIVAAIVPDTISDNARKVLTDNGVNTIEYRSGDDNDRLEKLNSVESAKFSREIDAEYMAAAESGDMETAQRMVDEAAKKAGYTIKAYHGTPNKFNVFLKSRIGSTTDYGWFGRGFYFTTKKDVADVYAGYLNDSNVIEAYLKVQNPFVFSDYPGGENMSAGEIMDAVLGKKYGTRGELTEEDKAQRSEDFTDWLRDNGYDGAEIWSQIMILDSEQAKRTDPVTYDNAGNIIPLSERFNPKNDDIRYSIEIDPEVAAQFSPEAIARRQSNRTKGVKGERKVSRVRSNTYEYSGLYNEVEAQMDEADEENYTYDPVSEKKSMNEALGRLKADFDGEVSRLSEADRQWGGSDLDTAMGILHRYRTEGRATGDYGDFWRWSKVIQEKGTKGGQFIQAFAKYTRTGTGAAMKGAKDIHDRFKLNPAQQKQVDAAKKRLMDGIDGDMDGAAQDAMKQAKGQKEPSKKQDGKVDKKNLDAEVQRRKDAERLVREISKLFEKQQDHGEPVENWLNLTGEELARKIAGRFSEPKQRTKTTMQTILSDLVGFAEEHALPDRKKAEGTKRTAIDIITDYLNNRDAYGTAWAAAQSYLRAAYTDDQEKLDALNSFLTATIAYNAEGTDRTMLDAILQSADVLGISEKRILELTSAGATASTIDRIGDELVNQVKERMGADYDESFTQQLKDAARRHITGIALQESAEEQRLRLSGMTTDAARQLEMNLQKLLTQSRGDKNKAAQSVADYLIRELGIPSSDAAIAAERITGAFMDELASRADRKLQQMFAEKKPKTQEQRDRLLDLIRLGGLTNSNVEDAVVDALGIGGMSRERQRELVGAMAQFGETLDAMEADDLDGLKELIRAQAAVRNTPLSRQAEKALAGETDAQYLREFALAQLDAIAGDFAEMSPGAKISTFQTISHLLNMRTALRNLTSNQVFDLVDSAANNLATIPDMVIGAFTGKRTVGTNKSWLSEMKRAGAKQGAARNALEVRLDVSPDDRQKSKYGTAGRRTNSMAASNAFGRILSHLEEVMGYELNTTDEFHKDSVRGETLESLARFVERGDITQEQANAWAEEEALYRSFQDDTLVGNIMGELKTLLNVIGFGDSGKTNSRGRTIHDFGLGDLVVKYTQVPGALIHRGIEYSPLGYAKMLYDLAIAKDSLVRTQKRGEDVTNAQRKLALDIGRATTGSGLITLFAVLARAGLLRRDDDDKDKNAKAMHAAQGLSGTQLNLTALKRWIEGGDLSLTDGDVLADIGFLEPLDSLMTIATLMANDDDLKLTDIGVKSLDGVWKAISNTSAMQTISNIISTVQYHDEENDLPLYFQIPIEIASDSISGFVPSPVRQLAQATDTTYRDQYRSKNLNDQIRARVANSIPGLRQTLAPKITPLGEDRKYQKPLLNYLNATLNPGNINVYQGSGVVDELNRVYGETDDAKIWPERNAPYSFTANDEKWTLTPDERTQYQRTRGQTTAKAMEAVKGTDWYKSMSATSQAEVLNWIGNFSNFVAKKEMLEARGQEYGSKTYDKYYSSWMNGTPIADVVAEKHGKLVKAAEETAAAETIIAEAKIPEASKEEAETMSSDAKRLYAAFLQGGVSDSTARKLATEMEGSEASGHEQWRMVYDAAGKEGEKAVTSVMTDDMKRNWDLAKGVGVSMDDYIKVREGFKDLNGNGKQTQDEWNATLDSYTFSTNEAKDKSIKGTLWQILTGSGSTKNNPYDKEAGQKVIDAKSSGGGSGSGSYAPLRLPTLRQPWEISRDEEEPGLTLAPLEKEEPRERRSSGLRLASESGTRPRHNGGLTLPAD